MSIAPTQSAPDTPGLLARVGPLRRRLRTEAGGAGVLLLATIVALLWVNSPWGDTYERFWHTEFTLGLGSAELALDLRHWVNDGLMAFFFFVVGLEVKRELVIGELADRRRAAVPAVAALAGLVVPALVYVAFNLDGPAVGAWGVVISTDTAFLLGVLALLGRSCPPQLRVMLLALAIADDVGALAVIAVVYTDNLNLGALALSVLGFALMLGLRWLRVWRGPAYLVLAAGSWVALYLSGVHPTLLGVAIALATPAYTARRDEVDDAARTTRAYLQSPNPEFARAARLSIDRSVPVGERLQQLWHPWTSFVAVPLFALANAGVTLTGESLREAATSPITHGVIAGLVLGKLLGIALGASIAVRLRIGELAPGVAGLPLVGGAALSGIGFTISLFIVDLAFDDDAQADQARVGILAASVLATVLGSALLRLAALRRPEGDHENARLHPPVDPVRDHVRGPVDAPLTLVEYADFECPFCGRANGAVDELRDRFGDRLRYVFRHAPLTDVHLHAQLAAEAAEAAGEQGRFWEMHDRLFAHQDRLTSIDLLDHATAVGLDVQRFARDLGSGRLARRVQHDLDAAEGSGVTGIPTFYINGIRHNGPHDTETLAAALLAAAEGALPPAPDEQSAAAKSSAAVLVRRAPLPELPEDLPETPDRGGDHPRLSDRHLAMLEQAGTRRTVARGDTLYQPGDAGYDFHVVLSGAVAVIGQLRPNETVVRVHGARRFLGELDLLSEQPVERTAVVIRGGEVLRLTVEQLRTVLTRDAVLRELILRAFLVRRAIRLQLAAELRVVGRAGSDDTRRIGTYAQARGLTTDIAEFDADGDANRLLCELGVSEADLPVVITRSGHVLSNPSDAELDRVLQMTAN
jgi:NhaA family Na+:H+ antiporter